MASILIQLHWGVGTGLSRTFRSKKSKKQCLAQGNHGYGRGINCFIVRWSELCNGSVVYEMDEYANLNDTLILCQSLVISAGNELSSRDVPLMVPSKSFPQISNLSETTRTTISICILEYLESQPTQFIETQHIPLGPSLRLSCPWHTRSSMHRLASIHPVGFYSMDPRARGKPCWPKLWRIWPQPPSFETWAWARQYFNRFCGMDEFKQFFVCNIVVGLR